MLSILITRPRYEKTTHYLFHWSSVLVDEANNKGKLYQLDKEKANKKLLESYLKKQNPDIVILNGHGNEYCVLGQDNEELISTGKNSNLLKNSRVYIRACSAGKILGKEIIKNGAKSFIGYNEPFVFYHKEEFTATPLKDDYAKPFFETSNQVGISLIKGKTAKEANEDSIKLYNKVISSLLTSKSANSFLIPDLLGNMSNQICLEA